MSTTTPPRWQNIRAVSSTGKNRKQRIAELEAENAALRERLGLGQTTSLELWDLMPQDMRDDLAARMIFQEEGHAFNALTRLGFKVPTGKPGEPTEKRNEMIRRVFDTPGVRARLERNFSDAEAQRDAIMARNVEIALRGTPDQAIRATQNIARLQGWLAHETPQAPQTVIQLWGLVAAERAKDEPKRVVGIDRPALAASTDILDVLGHEPGAAVRIDSNSADVDAALAQTLDEEPESAVPSEEQETPPQERERGIE